MFTSEDTLEINLAGLLRTLEASKAAIPVDEGAEHTSKTKSTRNVESSGVSETKRAAPFLENDGFDPELNEQLKLAAEEMMRELHEEYDRRERARASNSGIPSSSVNQSENAENEQVDDSGVTGMRVDNRYYLTIVLGRQEYEAFFDPGRTLSPSRPRVTDVLKDRLKEYDSVI